MDFREIAKQFLLLVSGRLDKYTTKKGSVKVERDSVILFTPSHIQFAKYGRGAGKMPPVEPLIDWVRKKGIVTEEKEIKGTAWAIAKSIAKNGTKNYVPNAPNAIEEAIEAEFDNYATRMAGFFSDEINNKVLEIMTQAIPDKVDIKL